MQCRRTGKCGRRGRVVNLIARTQASDRQRFGGNGSQGGALDRKRVVAGLRADQGQPAEGYAGAEANILAVIDAGCRARNAHDIPGVRLAVHGCSSARGFRSL